MDVLPLREALGAVRTLSIIGMGKNAGKTTVLGRLLGLLAEDPARTPALTSIGRDGEATDVVTGTKKPGIWVREGTLVATAADLLRVSDISREILDTTGVHTPLGEVIVLRALSDGFVEVAGPSMNEQLTALARHLRALGGDPVLIDGAIGRKSLAAPAVSEGTILCAGASYDRDMDRVIEDTAYACQLLALPVAEPGEGGGRHALAGAATDASVRALSPREGDEVVVEDSSRMLLSRTSYARWTAQGVRFAVRRRSRLFCVCVNPFSATGADFDGPMFLARMRRALSVPVVDVEAREA